MATTVISGVQYSGIWTMQQVNAAIAASTWPVPTVPGQGYLYSWGNNANGQLGLSNLTFYSSPKQVGSLITWVTLPTPSTGHRSIGAIKTDGTLWMWGQNDRGQLGLGNITEYSSPKQIGALTAWSKLTLGYQFTVALKTDGTLWSWGRGTTFGSLGLGNLTSYSSPKQVGALTNWLNISASYYSVVATKTDGTLWTWGWNQNGQLGLGNVTPYSSPKQVGSLTDWLKVFSSGYSCRAIKTDGTIWAWGNNNNGQLGDGTITYRSSPTQIGSLTNWANSAGGTNHSIATKTDGTIWTWGANGVGQLGLGNTTNYSSPKQVGSLTTWSIPAGGYSFTGAIKTDGTLWLWGNNVNGQLGLGNRTNYSSPKQVGSLTTWTSVYLNGPGQTFVIVSS